TAVTATITNPAAPGGTSTVNLYGVGTYAGTNKAIQSIQVAFDRQIDPATITAQSVQLEASGGTGLFDGNPKDFFIGLTGKLSVSGNVLTINLGAVGLTLGN